MHPGHQGHENFESLPRSENHTEPVYVDDLSDIHDLTQQGGSASVGTRPALREAFPAQAVNALEIAPNPGAMSALYVEAREKYADGMSLALATPRRPYEEIVREYAARHQEPGFSPIGFWDENFETPDPDDTLLEAAPGTSLDDYTKHIRPLFIHPRQENSSFDISLPYDRSVAGAGRFSQHSFLWDGYHMAVGYRRDKRWDLVLNIVDNYEFEINRFGHGLNGSAAFFATRTQPPYFSHEVSMLADEYGDEALERYLPAMEKEYEGYWMDGRKLLEQTPHNDQIYKHRTLVRVPLGNGRFGYLNRYWDDADGPRLESYREDFELGQGVANGLSGALRERRLHKLYKDLRAGAASGWDYSSRWFEDGHSMASINTTDILPVDLNSLLARTEQMLARAHHAAGNTEKALQYEQRFTQRVEAINKYLWDSEGKIYRDYNMKQKRQTDIVSAAMAYPLYVGIANTEQTFGVARAIEQELLFPGGVVATTTEASSHQWDGGKKGGGGQKNVWAPPNWATARGLARMAHILATADRPSDVLYLLDLAEEVRSSYLHGIQTTFDANRVVPEKHCGDDPAKIGSGGEYKPVKVLAMPAEVWRAMVQWDPYDPQGCLPVGAEPPRI